MHLPQKMEQNGTKTASAPNWNNNNQQLTPTALERLYHFWNLSTQKLSTLNCGRENETKWNKNGVGAEMEQ